MLRCPWLLVLLFAGVEVHEGNQLCSTQVVLVRSLSSFPRVLGLWVGSRSTTTLRHPILTRTVSGLTAMRRIGSPSVPGFVVLLAPLQPSSCCFSRSRWVDFLVPPVGMGAPLVISLCCVLCRLLPRELLQGFWCRLDCRVVPLVRDILPRVLGASQGFFHCVELRLCVARLVGTRLPCRIRRFHLLWPRVCASRPVCGWSVLSLHAGCSCTLFYSSLCVSFLFVSLLQNFVLLQTCRQCLRDFEPFKESFSTR